nr:immunoglobulin heavy chain junction region [Macaca mulatta]
CSTLEGLNEYW